jgi:hypothetical protein
MFAQNQSRCLREQADLQNIAQVGESERSSDFDSMSRGNHYADILRNTSIAHLSDLKVQKVQKVPMAFAFHRLA